MRKTIFLLSAAILFCACSPLHYQLYLRNHTHGMIRLTVTGQNAFAGFGQPIFVRYKQAILPIKKKTRKELTDSLALQWRDEHHFVLEVPPDATVYLSDLLPLTEHSGGQTLVIERPGAADTLVFEYPYRHIRQLRRKPDPGYRYFYRTIGWIDIQ